jgi:GH15 family glucan-1,4-alpha-glucosidase
VHIFRAEFSLPAGGRDSMRPISAIKIFPDSPESLDRYGVIGDTRTAVLVSADGSIDWACLPDFDSPALFAQLLDVRGGCFSIRPATAYTSRQYYESGTNILVTEFMTQSGKICLRDFMPYIPQRKVATAEIHRILECAEGKMQIALHFAPRFEYGATIPEFTISKSGVLAVAGTNSVVLSASVDCEKVADAVSAIFDVAAGDELSFIIDWGLREIHPPLSYQTYKRIWETRRFWRDWIGRMDYQGRYREAMERSLLTLKLLSYEPTGAIVAAPTASLPAWPGGTRNWDYRFTWIRDSAFILGAFFRAGYTEEGTAYFDFILQRVFDGKQLKILYDIHGQPGGDERVLTHLAGYADSTPVRIGNAASDQLQLDVYGSLLDAAWRYQNFGGILTNTEWTMLKEILHIVEKRWREPDSGIWEARSKLRHYTYSKVWAWVAFDRAMRIADRLGFKEDIPRWKNEAEIIRGEILQRGWSTKHSAFSQAYDTDILDASLLIMPEVGFIGVEDPLFQRTLAAIKDQLGDAETPLFYRYDGKVYDDGVGGPEGRFLLMSFWYIDCLILEGKLSAARAAIEKMLALRNPLGLYSECVHIDETGNSVLLGNFPQGFSHLGLVNSLFKLHQARKLSEV